MADARRVKGGEDENQRLLAKAVLYKCPRSNTFRKKHLNTNDFYCAASVALLTGCHVASGSYATISLASWSVVGPKSF